MRYCRNILSSSWRRRRVKLLTVKFVTPRLRRCRTLKFSSIFFFSDSTSSCTDGEIQYICVCFFPPAQADKKKKTLPVLLPMTPLPLPGKKKKQTHFLPNDRSVEILSTYWCKFLSGVTLQAVFPISVTPSMAADDYNPVSLPFFFFYFDVVVTFTFRGDTSASPLCWPSLIRPIRIHHRVNGRLSSFSSCWFKVHL